MARRQLSAFRLIALTVALGASALMLVSSQMPWMDGTSRINAADIYGLSINLDGSEGLGSDTIEAIVIAAFAVAVLTVISLIPYLRFLCAAVVVIGAASIAFALEAMNMINNMAAGLSVYSLSPGVGIYVLIAGGTLAVISGALTLLTPRIARLQYRYGMVPYNTSEGQAVVSQRLREKADGTAAAAPMPASEDVREPPIAGVVAKRPSRSFSRRVRRADDRSTTS